MEQSQIPSMVLNHDIAGLINRIQRFIVECAKSGSAGVSAWSTHDLARLRKYLNNILALHKWMVDQPELDLPETHPRAYAFQPDPQIPPMESESVRDVVRMLELCRDELKSCQSARLAAGMMKADTNRFLAIIEKVDKFLSGVVENESASPLDLPETAPMRAVPPQGNVGL